MLLNCGASNPGFQCVCVCVKMFTCIYVRAYIYTHKYISLKKQSLQAGVAM